MQVARTHSFFFSSFPLPLKNFSISAQLHRVRCSSRFLPSKKLITFLDLESRRSSRVGAQSPPNWQGAELNGVGGGAWSEGQALRNLRRHRELNGLPPYTAADGLAGGGVATARTAKSGREGVESERGRAQTTQTAFQRLGRTPAPGYTGHLIGKEKGILGDLEMKIVVKAEFR